jgi:CRP-like cAMP-binding protein
MACLEIFTKTFAVGDWLFRYRDPADCAILIRRGSVKLFLDGRLDIGTFGQGSVLALAEVFNCGEYQTDAIAVEETVAEYIPQTMLITLLLHNPKYRFEILNGVSNDVHKLIDRIHSLPRVRKYGKRVPTGFAAPRHAN